MTVKSFIPDNQSYQGVITSHAMVRFLPYRRCFVASLLAVRGRFYTKRREKNTELGTTWESVSRAGPWAKSFRSVFSCTRRKEGSDESGRTHEQFNNLQEDFSSHHWCELYRKCFWKVRSHLREFEEVLASMPEFLHSICKSVFRNLRLWKGNITWRIHHLTYCHFYSRHVVVPHEVNDIESDMPCLNPFHWICKPMIHMRVFFF